MNARPSQHQGVLEDVVFLAEAHGIDRMVLIAHDSCAFYAMRLGFGGDLEPQQHADLRQAAVMIRERLPEMRIDAYFARVAEGDRIRFEPVSL